MRTLVLISLALSASVASAQRSADPSGLADAGRHVAEAEAAAIAGAARPGDEDLSCEALQTEMVSIAQGLGANPGLQAAAAQAEAELARVQEAQQGAEEQAARGRPRIGQMMRGFGSAMVPGADRANAAAQQAQAIAQAEQARAQALQNQQRITSLAGDAAAMAGPAMRGARVIELARARNCAWAQEGAVPPGFAAPPSAVPPTPQQ
jgi:hypothetical protein